MPDTTPLGPSPFAELDQATVGALIEPMTKVASRAFVEADPNGLPYRFNRRHGEDVARNLLQGLADGVEGPRAFEHAIDGIARVREIAGLDVCTDEHRVAAELCALYLEAHVAGWAEEPSELGFRQALTWAGVPGRVAVTVPRPRWRAPRVRLAAEVHQNGWARVLACTAVGAEVADVCVWPSGATIVAVRGAHRLTVHDADGETAVRFVEQVCALLDHDPLDGVDLREMVRLGRETLAGEAAA